jgi:hypothetical protein
MSGPHPDCPITRLFLLAAAVMPVIFFFTQIAAAPFYPGYSFSQQSVSMLGTHFYRPVFSKCQDLVGASP